MEWYEVKVDSGRSLKFPEKVSSDLSAGAGCDNETKLGGIINRGEWAWIAKKSTLQVVSLKRGNTVSTFEFTESKGYDNCEIICVDQICPQELDGVYLAVCLSTAKCPGNSLVAFYSVNHSTVLSFTEMQPHITCCRYISSTACRHSLMQNFDGCLALGSDEGYVVLIDVNMQKMLAVYENQKLENISTPQYVMDYNVALQDIHRNYKQCQQKGVKFCLQLEVVDEPCAVQCILPIDSTMSLAIGLEDGRLVLYDLTELQIFHITTPDSQSEVTPLVQMDFLEPSDDPKPCVYIWALHAGEHSLSAVLHSLMYEKRSRDRGDNCFLETFQTSNVRLRLPLEKEKCGILSCQAIMKSIVSEEDDAHSLCALSWHVLANKTTKLLIFDLNQWYKEEMPFLRGAEEGSHYLSTYILNGKYYSMQLYINPTTIAYFNSMQRFEEHFYPNSLSFDGILLMRNGCVSYNWAGAQNRFISTLRRSNATLFLEADTYFNEIMRTHLMPQFCEHNPKGIFSRKAKYEIILSVALEYNCFSLLSDCAKCWVDGSFMGNSSTPTGISLSLLTDWVWKRASDIKARCNDLCQCLFNFVGFPLDQREQKELGFISRQLKLLADLSAQVLTFAKRVVPDKVYTDFELKYKSLRMASEYQEVLLWLLNIGLLPEASRCHSKAEVDAGLVPYPYDVLKEMYAKKRQSFGKISDSFISKKKGNCRLVYIDTFIEHECKGNVNDYWMESNGNGLYPPPSIESMLRIMLVPDMSHETKCAILLYFFLDLDMTINDQAYKNVVANFIKFPSVFKLSASLIKTVQAFWNLDHGHFLPAVDEFLSPFNKNQNYPQWLLDLLIEALLIQNASKLALRVLEAYSSLISPVLKLQALLVNELFPEAFHFARSKKDDRLLEQFFKWCLHNGHFGVMRDLALNEKEDKIAQNVLKLNNAENLHFVYLLQKSKYLEAVSYMDEISKSKCIGPYLQNTTVNTPNLVLSAYKPTMTPLTQGLTDVYFRIKNKIRRKEVDDKSPVPLSCQLIKHNANQLLGGMYHSSALSAHFASYYWDEMDAHEKPREASSSLLSSNNAPFLRRPQMGMHLLDFDERIATSYPQIYRATEKRTLAECDSQAEGEKKAILENPKKRRKIDGNDIFKDYVKNASCLESTDFKIIPEESEKRKDPKAKAIENFLIQPPPLHTHNTHLDVTAENVTNSNTSGLHSILKMSTPEPAECSSMRENLKVEEETKNLRFKLPAVEEVEEAILLPRVDENLPDKNLNDRRNHEICSHNQDRVVHLQEKPCEKSPSNVGSSRVLSNANLQFGTISSQNEVAESHIKNTRLTEGPKSRKPIERASVEPEIFVETEASKETGLLKENMARSEIEIGFKNFVDAGTRASATTSVMSVGSNINNFQPQVSSSKVCETQSKFAIEETVAQVKFSEKSTVLGTITCYGSAIHTSTELEDFEERCTKITHKLSTKELETTLGMSSYDFTFSDATAGQEAIVKVVEEAADDVIVLSSDDEMGTIYSEGSNGNNESDRSVSTYDDLEEEEEQEVEEEEEEELEEVDEETYNSVTNDSVEDILENSKNSAEREEKNDIDYQQDTDTDEMSEEHVSEESKDAAKYETLKEELSFKESEVYGKSYSIQGHHNDSDEDLQIDLNLPCGEDNEQGASQDLNDLGELSEKPEDNIAKVKEHADESIYMDAEEGGFKEENVADKINNMDVDSIDATISVPRRLEENIKENPDSCNEIVCRDGSLISKKSNEKCDDKELNILENCALPSQDDRSPDSSLLEAGCVPKDKLVRSQDFQEYITDYGNDHVDLLNTEDQGSIANSIEGNRQDLGDTSIKLKSREELSVDSGRVENVKHDERSTADNSVSPEVLTKNNYESSPIVSTLEQHVIKNIDKRNDSVNDVDEDSCGDECIVVVEASAVGEDAACVDKVTSLDVVTEEVVEAVVSVEKSTNHQDSVIGFKDEQNETSISSKAVTHKGCEPAPEAGSVPLSPLKVANSDLRKHKTARASSEGPADDDQNMKCIRDSFYRSGQSKSSECSLISEESLTGSTERNLSSPWDQLEGNTPQNEHKVLKPRTRGASVPPTFTKVESAPILDSPSSRTRSRTRLSSVDNRSDEGFLMSNDEVPVSKRTRRNSLTSNLSDQPVTTPTKRTRRNTLSSQPEIESPRLLRARSVTAVSSGDIEARQTGLIKRKRQRLEKLDDNTIEEVPEKEATRDNPRNEKCESATGAEAGRKRQSTSRKSELNTASSYSSLRRLTRTQLAMLEKSSALTDVPEEDGQDLNFVTLNTKRVAKRRTSTSATISSQPDSDDSESIVSNKSSASAATGRRLTRSSSKQKDGVDDDGASVASSLYGGKYGKRRTSIDTHGTSLTAIKEEQLGETSAELKKSARRPKP